jgi:hypothetical protein
MNQELFGFIVVLLFTLFGAFILGYQVGARAEMRYHEKNL